MVSAWVRAVRLCFSSLAQKLTGSPMTVYSSLVLSPTAPKTMRPVTIAMPIGTGVSPAATRSAAQAAMAPCKRQNEREREAYWIQDQYLQRIGHGGMTGVHYSNRLWPRCFDE